MRVRTRGDVRATRERERSVERSEVETKVCERAVSGGGRAGRGGDGATVEGGVGEEEEEAKVAELVELVELEFVREREWEREFEHVGVVHVVVGVIVVVVGVIVVVVGVIVVVVLLLLLLLLARPKEETPRLVQATLRIE